ncbi:MAG: hypothetical protein JSS79_15115 [Bacteroidetes bacterium]|nr:hypothetical protein [Bacteroidota bacterium]
MRIIIFLMFALLGLNSGKAQKRTETASVDSLLEKVTFIFDVPQINTISKGVFEVTVNFKVINDSEIPLNILFSDFVFNFKSADGKLISFSGFDMPVVPVQAKNWATFKVVKQKEFKKPKQSFEYSYSDYKGIIAYVTKMN